MSAPTIDFDLDVTSRRYAVTGAPTVRDSQGKTFNPTALQVDVYPDEALAFAVTVSGQVFDEIGPTGHTSSVRWLDGERFTAGIANGLPALRTAPSWVLYALESILTGEPA